jgi:hypothetical protein
MENLGELFAAMAMARQEFSPLTKGKTATIKSDKGSYGYSYVDLSDIIEATAGALAKHGLVIIQEPEVVSDGNRQLVVIHGCIAHKSGAVYTFRSLPMAVAGGTAQAIGSAISYARRYQMSAVLNLAAADDDGNEASKPAAKPAKPVDNPFVEPGPALASQAQLDALGKLGVEFYGPEEWDEQLPKLTMAVTKGATEDVLKLRPTEADKLINGLKRKMAEVKEQVPS